MHVTIDRHFVSEFRINSVKSQVEDFKGRYTPKKLLDAFGKLVPLSCINEYGRIIACDLSAFHDHAGDNVYMVDMVIDFGHAFDRLHFFIGQAGEIDVDEDLCRVTHYSLKERKTV